MRKALVLLAVVIGSAVMALPAVAQENAPLASLESFSGEVKVGLTGSENWAPVTAGLALAENQSLRTGPLGQATVRFTEGDLVTVVGEKTVVSVPDLLLKAKLEKMRSKVSQPGENVGQTKIQVTPLTGVRGTEEAEGKAEEMKREHHWEENVETAK